VDAGAGVIRRTGARLAAVTAVESLHSFNLGRGTLLTDQALEVSRTPFPSAENLFPFNKEG